VQEQVNRRPFRQHREHLLASPQVKRPVRPETLRHEPSDAAPRELRGGAACGRGEREEIDPDRFEVAHSVAFDRLEH